jgi:hypothetical protein
MFKVTTFNGTEVLDTETINDIEDLSLIRRTREKIAAHFGCAHPEGYRKALRCMKLAEKFGLPVVTLIDTQGAYPGIGAEERGQAEAIALNLRDEAGQIWNELSNQIVLTYNTPSQAGGTYLITARYTDPEGADQPFENWLYDEATGPRPPRGPWKRRASVSEWHDPTYRIVTTHLVR